MVDYILSSTYMKKIYLHRRFSFLTFKVEYTLLNTDHCRQFDAIYYGITQGSLWNWNWKFYSPMWLLKVSFLFIVRSKMIIWKDIGDRTVVIIIIYDLLKPDYIIFVHLFVNTFLLQYSRSTVNDNWKLLIPFNVFHNEFCY